MTPHVGQGATIHLWSDRHACTIVRVVRFKTNGKIKGVEVQRDNAVWNGVEYVYTPNPDAYVDLFLKGKDDRYKNKVGESLTIGVRSEHFDLTF